MGLLPLVRITILPNDRCSCCAIGGGGATPVTVTSCSELQSAFAIGGVIHILGTLSGCGVLDLKVGNTCLFLRALDIAHDDTEGL